MEALDRRLHAARPDIADRALQGRVEAARFVEGVPRRVVSETAPIRSVPDLAASLDTEALHGEAVRVFEEANGWAYVQLQADRYVGYMPAEALGDDGPAPTHRVSALRTLVFPAPDIKRPVARALPLGAMVAVVGEAEDRNARYHALAGGGFVVARHLAPLGTFAADPVAEAMRFLGAPYLWGGRTSLGIDCSGLVQAAFGAAGIALPRDSDMQERAERLRTLEAGAARRRGDLVFWPGHVGILIDPDTLLHANAHAMATVIEPLAEAAARIAARGASLRAIRRLA